MHSDKDTKNRIKELDQEIADTTEKTKELEAKWKNEKGLLDDIRRIKKELEQARIDEENAEMNSNLEKTAEIDRLHEQKNENRGRNKKKAAEKKAEALADNDKKLPKAEDIDTAGMEKTKGCIS